MLTLTTVPLTDTYDANYLTYVSSVPPSQDTISDGVLDWNDLTGTPAGFGVDLAPGQSFVVIVNFVGRADTTEVCPGFLHGPRQYLQCGICGRRKI